MKKILVMLLAVAMVASLCGMMFVSAEEAQKLSIASFEITSGNKQPVSDTRNGNLIDGVLGDGASDQLDSGLWYAFGSDNTVVEEGGSSPVGCVMLDLGAECTVSEIKVHFLGQHPGDPATIWGVFASYSNDGVNWTALNNYADTGALGVWDQSENEFWASLVPQTEEPLVTRYLTVKVGGMTDAINAGQQLFVSEIEVYGTAPAPVENTKADVSVNDNACLTDDVTDVAVAWPDSNGKVCNIMNGNCQNVGMDVAIVYALGETKWVDGVTAYFYVDTNSMIGYPEGKATVMVSSDGTNYTSVGEYNLAAVDYSAACTVKNEFTFDAVEAAYVKILVYAGSNAAVLGDSPTDGKVNWEFISLTEVDVSETTAPVEPSEPSKPETVIVPETIEIDGKLNDDGYNNATWFSNGLWQTADGPVLEGIDASYTTRCDDDNIYLTIKVTDEVVLAKALDSNAWDQSGATNFRIWLKGDGMETRTFYDLLWDGEKFVPHRQKVATDELTFVANTDNGTIELEIKIAKTSLAITNSYELMVTYSAPDFVAGETVGYNAYHMTSAVRDEDGNLPSGWSGNTSMYEKYECADVALGTYEVEVPAQIPGTGDAGLLVFAVLGIIAICGAAVVIKARG